MKDKMSSPTKLVCGVKIRCVKAYHSFGPINGMICVECNSGKWYLRLKYDDESKIPEVLQLTKSSLENYDPNIVNKQNGFVLLTVALRKKGVYKFVTNDKKGKSVLVKISKVLNNIIGFDDMKQQFGNTIHDLSSDENTFNIFNDKKPKQSQSPYENNYYGHRKLGNGYHHNGDEYENGWSPNERNNFQGGVNKRGWSMNSEYRHCDRSARGRKFNRPNRGNNCGGLRRNGGGGGNRRGFDNRSQQPYVYNRMRSSPYNSLYEGKRQTWQKSPNKEGYNNRHSPPRNGHNRVSPSRRPNRSQQPLRDRGSADNSLDRVSSDREFSNVPNDDENQTLILIESSKCPTLNDTEDPSQGKNSNSLVKINHPKSVMDSAKKTTNLSETKSPSISSPNIFYRNSNSRFFALTPFKSSQSESGSTTTTSTKPTLASVSSPKSQTTTTVSTKRSTAPLTPAGVSSPIKKSKLSEEEDKENRASAAAASSTARPGLINGFKNFGNTCYMNAVLQALFSVDCFAKDVVATYSSVKKWSDEESLFRRFAELLIERNSFSSAHQNSFYVTLLKGLKSDFEKLFPRFEGSQMQDAHEFLIHLLDKVKEQMDSIGKKSNPERKSQHNSVKRFFQYELKQIITCKQCSNEYISSQIAYDFSVHMSKSARNNCHSNLQFALDRTFKREDIEYHCEKCGSNSSCKTVKLTEIPRIICIHLKRYATSNSGNRLNKNLSSLNIPKYLTLLNHALPGTTFIKETEEIVERSPGINTTDNSSKPVENGSGDVAEPGGANMSAEVISVSVSEQRANEFSTHNSGAVGLFGGDGPFESGVGIDYVAAGDDTIVGMMGPENVTESATQEEQIWQQTEELQLIELTESKEDDEDEQIKAAKKLSLQELNNGDAKVDDSDEEGEDDDGDYAYTEEERKKLEENFLKGDLEYSYRLKSVVEHCGDSYNSGHYKTHAVINYNKKKMFLTYDDSEVDDLSSETGFLNNAKNGYIFLYVNKAEFT